MKITSRCFTFLLVLLLAASLTLSVSAADLDLGIRVNRDNESTGIITVTISNSEDADTILAASPAKLEIPCSFASARVLYGEQVITGVVLDTAADKIIFPVAKGGTYTIEEVSGFTVTFDTDGGSAVEPQTVAQGDKLEAPTAPTKDGHIFSGWYKEEALTTLWNFETDTVTADTTLYAKWVPAVTVTFQSNGGSAVSSQTVAQGDRLVAPTAPTKDGHIFSGWYKEETFTTLWNFETDTVTADTTLYAKWTPMASISLTPDNAKLYPGDAQTFTVTVNNSTESAKNITWSVSGSDEDDTAISSTGRLKIGKKETPKTLTVTATAKLGDDTVSASVSVRVCPVYKFISGNGKKWSQNSTRSLTFICDGPYENLKAITVNGSTLSNAYASDHTDGTQITLTSAYLKTLRRGTYLLEAFYDDDGYADTTFKIIASSGNASTGDMFRMGLWLTLLFGSIAGVAALLIYNKKKK